MINAVGKGWYCPNPQRKQQEEGNAKRAMAAQHKADYERRRRENKAAYSLREQAALMENVCNIPKRSTTP